MKLLGGKRSAPAVRLCQSCSVICVREGREIKECFTVPLFCVNLETNYAFSFDSEPASAPCVWLTGIKEWAWKAGFIAVSFRRDLNIPAMHSRAEEPINPCPQGRGSVCHRSKHACGDREPMPVCRCFIALWHKSIMWWVSDAGGTVLIDPS